MEEAPYNSRDNFTQTETVVTLQKNLIVRKVIIMMQNTADLIAKILLIISRILMTNKKKTVTKVTMKIRLHTLKHLSRSRQD